MKEERNALQKEVFPKLRKLCMEKGFRFQAIDLRWGVSEEAGLDQQTMKICLEEIERSQRVSPKPNFIVLLGNRYGWRPLPYEIPADEFEEILDKVSEKDKPFLSWKGDLLDDEQLKKREGWYCLDTNALDPVYCLKPRFVDYDENDPDDMIKEAKDKEAADWYEKEERIKTLLLNAIEELNWPKNDPRRSKYEDSATEQEIMKGVLEPPKNIPHPEEHVFCFFREIEDKESITYNENSENFLDFNKSKVIDELSAKKLEFLKEEIREKLPEKNIITYQTSWNGNSVKTNHLDDLCRDVYLSLACTIMKQIEEYEEKDPLDLEIEAHKEFGKERCKFFIGREENRDKIKDYLESPNSEPMVVYGDSGSGKSALMAQAIEDSSTDFYKIKEDDDLSNDGLVVRFIGATPESSDLRSLLESLSRQITKIYGEDDSNIPSEYNDLVQDFKERLNFATDEKPLFIFLDALDQLSDSENAHNLTWIPDELPENVNIILSTLKEPFQSYIENRLPDDNSDEVLKLDEGKELLEAWLKNAERKLTDEQENEIIGKFEVEGLPLYLKLAFEEAKIWKSYSSVPELKSDIFGIINFMFERLSRPENHGEILVSHSLGYLSAAKNGLTEDEMLDILALDEEVFNLTKKFHNPPEEKLPVALWSRLYFDLEPYLTERSADGTSLLAFYHRQLGEVTRDEYVKQEFKNNRHKLIAKYFDKQDLSFNKNGELKYNIRKVSELPYQQIYGEIWDKLINNLSSLEFIEAKCAVGMTYDLVIDYNTSLELLPEAKDVNLDNQKRKKRIKEYTSDLIKYSNKNVSKIEIIPSIEPLNEKTTKKQDEIHKQSRLDLLKTFFQFVNYESHNLEKYGDMPGFCLQQAYNYSDNGPVVEAAKKIIFDNQKHILFLKNSAWKKKNPFSKLKPLIKTFEGKNDTIVNEYLETAFTFENSKTVYWDLKTGSPLKILKGKFLSFSLDGTRTITTNGDELIYWDLKNGKMLNNIIFTPAKIAYAIISSERDRAICVHSDHSLRLYNLKENSLPKYIGKHDLELTTLFLASNNKKAITAYENGTIVIWDLEKSTKIKEFKGHDGPVQSLFLTPDGKNAISGDVSGFVKIWDLDNSKLIKEIKTDDAVIRVGMTSDGKKGFFIYGMYNPKIEIWEFQGVDFNKLAINSAISFDVTPDIKKAVIGDREGNIRIWDFERGKQTKKINKDKNPITRLKISPDGKRALSGSIVNLRLWDTDKGKQLKKIKSNQGEFLHLDFTPDGKRCVTLNNMIQTLPIIIWDLKSGKEISRFEQDSMCLDLFMSPDGENVVTLNNDQSIRVFELNKKTEKRFEGEYKQELLNVSIDGKKAIIEDNTGFITIFDLEKNEQIKQIKKSADNLKNISFGLKENKIILIYDKFIEIFDINTGLTAKIYDGYHSNIKIARITPDGRNVIIKSADGEIFYFDLENEKSKELKLTSHDFKKESLNNIENPNVEVIDITPDGKLAVTGDWEGNIILWDIEKEIEIKRFNGNNINFDYIKISPDGRNAITKDNKGVIKIWDIENGIDNNFNNNKNIITSVITPDQKNALTITDNSIQIWDLNTSKNTTFNVLSNEVNFITFTPDNSSIIMSDSYKFLFSELNELKKSTNSQKTIQIFPVSKSMIQSDYKGLKLWDAKKQNDIFIQKNYSEPIYNITLTNDGRKAITRSHLMPCPTNNIVKSPCSGLRIFDIGLKKEIYMNYRDSSIKCFAITPDDKNLVVVNQDMLQLYNLSNISSELKIKNIKKLENNQVNVICTSYDGRKIATGDKNGEIKVYEIEKANINKIKTFKGHYDEIIKIKITSDGKKILTASNDSTIRLWDIEFGKCISLYKTEGTPKLFDYKNRDVLIENSGELLLLNLYNFNIELPSLTPVRTWLHGENQNRWDNNFSSYCEFCSKKFIVPKEILSNIHAINKKYNISNNQSSLINLPYETWEDQSLISKCPNCQVKFKFNPFFVDNYNDEKIEKKEYANLQNVKTEIESLVNNSSIELNISNVDPKNYFEYIGEYPKRPEISKRLIGFKSDADDLIIIIPYEKSGTASKTEEIPLETQSTNNFEEDSNSIPLKITKNEESGKMKEKKKPWWKFWK